MAKFLYNGVELPALPNTYGNMMIVDSSDKNYIGTGTYLLASGSEIYRYKDYDGIQVYKIAGPSSVYKLQDGEWAHHANSVESVFAVYTIVIWANHNVIDTDDGTLVIAASDPIPVTTAAPIDPTSFMQGWLVGRMIAAMRGKVSAEQAKTVTITWDGNTEGKVHSTGYYDCFYKVSDLVPTMDKFTDVQYKSLTTDGEVHESGQLTNIVLMDNGVIWAGDFVARVVPQAGLSANIAGQECTFPEPGIYFCLWNGFYTAELTYTTTV